MKDLKTIINESVSKKTREAVQEYIDIIEQTNAREFPTEEDTYRFMNKGGWKVRNNGRDIKTIPITSAVVKLIMLQYLKVYYNHIQNVYFVHQEKHGK